MENPLTDKDLGIPHTGRHDDRFRDVRKKARLEEEDRHKKFKRSKRTKEDKEKLPKYKIGEEVVLTGGYSKKHYYLVEVIDFESYRHGDFGYFAILKRTTDPDKFDRIGRLITFEYHSWWSRSYMPANVENKGIKWLITPDIRLNGYDAGYIEPVK